MTAKHAATGEGNLHDLDDDTYFEAIAQMPKVFDADGNEVAGLFDDVVDARDAKARGEFAP